MSLDSIKNLLIDMDGVLWHAFQPVPGLVAFFETLCERGMNFRLVSNNSVSTLDEYVEKLGKCGVQVSREQIVTSAYATADWLREQIPQGARVYVVGGAGLREALAEAGFTVIVEDPPETVEAVVSGLDLRFTYATLHHASRLARGGALFVGSNPDTTIPIPQGLAPGAGSMQAAISAASGVEPIVVGKPNPLMFEQALRRMGASPDESAMLGDRLETDILGGQRAGLKTILVLSGVSRRDDLAGSEIQPTWVFDDIAALTAALQEGA